MSDADPKLPFYEKSFVGIGLSAVAIFATIWICRAASAPPEVSQTASAVALGVPTAAYYALRGRSRNKKADAAALARGQLDRPAGLVIVLTAAGLLLLDTILGVAGAVFSDVPALDVIVYLVAAVAVVVGSLFASVRLGSHPYRGILIAVAVALVARLLILASLMSTALEALGAPADFAPVLYVIVIVTYLLYLGLALLGARIGATRRRRYLADRLARLAATHPAEVAAAVANVPEGNSATTTATTAAAAPAAPAGWYSDTELRGIERWWDGSNWTDHRRNTPDPA